jgi:hypothetical protein
VLVAADRLAALLTDIHNPLALTKNFDGQLSDQHGLWVRFSHRLPDALARHLKLKVDVAHLIDDPPDFLFGLIRSSYVWADNVLYEEDLATRTAGGHGALYYDALAERLRPLLEERLGAATNAVASYWYSAWVAAGKPDVKTLR